MPTSEEIKEFSLQIESISEVDNISCIDAIIQYCDENALEIEVSASLISNHLKSLILEEAQSANLMKKTSKLPF